MLLFEIAYVILQALAWIALIAGLGIIGVSVWSAVEDWVEQRQRERRAEIERALDRTQAELRRTVLALADALAEERLAASHASEQMVARAYLTTGRLP